MFYYHTFFVLLNCISLFTTCVLMLSCTFMRNKTHTIQYEQGIGNASTMCKYKNINILKDFQGEIT